MASTTPNIGLTLPTGAEKVSRQIVNANNTIIDGKMGAVPVGQNLQGEIDALNGKFTTDFQRSRMISLNWRSYSSLKAALEAQATVYSEYDIVIANSVLNGGAVYFGFIWRKDSSNFYAVFFGSTGVQTTLNTSNGGSTWTVI